MAVVVDDNDSGLITIPETGTSGIRLMLEVSEGPEIGKRLPWVGFLTDAAFDNTLKALVLALGFSGDFDEVLKNANLFSGKKCSFKAEFEEYQGKERLKIRWLNPVNGGVGAPVLKADAAKQLVDRINSRSKSVAKTLQTGGITKPATKPFAGADDDIYF